MVSKKIDQNLDAGLWVETRHGNVASAFYSLGDYEDGEYILNWHDGHMPAYRTERFGTAEELEVAMRKIEPDLRRWKTRID